MEDLYYHISDIKNIDSIIEKGLLADEDGNIFLFINESIDEPGIARNKQGKLCMGMKRRSVSDDIALNQLFLKEYALFEISAKGIEGKLKNDNVEELASIYHRIARQQQIKPEFIKLCGIYKVSMGELIDEWRVLTEEEAKLYSQLNGLE
jgi:hypothetical protein